MPKSCVNVVLKGKVIHDIEEVPMFEVQSRLSLQRNVIILQSK